MEIETYHSKQEKKRANGLEKERKLRREKSCSLLGVRNRAVVPIHQPLNLFLSNTKEKLLLFQPDKYVTET